MHEARFGADEFAEMGQEGDDVVLGFTLDRIDAGDVEGRRRRPFAQIGCGRFLAE